MTTLATLPTGAKAILGEVSVVDATTLRLVEMGLTPGTEIVLVRRAPFGDPIEIEVRGTRVCLRRLEATRFIVDE